MHKKSPQKTKYPKISKKNQTFRENPKKIPKNTKKDNNKLKKLGIFQNILENPKKNLKKSFFFSNNLKIWKIFFF